MSLDIYLTLPQISNPPIQESAIFIRENGRTKKISRPEWDKLHPDREPVVCKIESDPREVFHGNITGNLYPMANAAGCALLFWEPAEMNVSNAASAIPHLEKALSYIIRHRTELEQFNPGNGWGSYDTLLQFTCEYLDACRSFPTAIVSISA